MSYSLIIGLYTQNTDILHDHDTRTKRVVHLHTDTYTEASQLSCIIHVGRLAGKAYIQCMHTHAHILRIYTAYTLS